MFSTYFGFYFKTKKLWSKANSLSDSNDPTSHRQFERKKNNGQDVSFFWIERWLCKLDQVYFQLMRLTNQPQISIVTFFSFDMAKIAECCVTCYVLFILFIFDNLIDDGCRPIGTLKFMKLFWKRLSIVLSHILLHFLACLFAFC